MCKINFVFSCMIAVALVVGTTDNITADPAGTGVEQVSRAHPEKTLHLIRRIKDAIESANVVS